ncbi:MAG: Ppx/GppA family phosphatase [Deltaproteobacteria bacterium]|nr:Ppx/GppA family phosphatase [Deltaproteobacteria bacterium]
MSARVATIDIGTNSVLLLVAEQDGRHVRALAEHATITRLGEGVDATHVLAEAAVGRTLACLQQYATEIARWNVTSVAVVGTSAMRDAAGGDEFCERAEQLLGVRPQVISGEREAQLTFDGALVGLEPEGLLAVFDIGGGSTEIIVGARVGRGRGTLARGVSLDIGAVRLTERHVKNDPPLPTELEAIRRDVRQALRAAPSMKGRPLVGVAGTVTTLTAFVHGVAPYDARLVHGAVLSAEALTEASTTLASVPLAARRLLAGIEPKRADVIVAGALIAEEICAAAEADRVIASDRGVRWGLALECLERTAS